MKRLNTISVSLAALSLTACGQSAPKVAAVAAPVGIFTSAQDCAASEKLPVKDCNILIQQVVTAHQNTAKSYISMRLCEEGEGEGKCERADPKTFRRSLIAFQVTFSTPPVAVPLYPSKEKNVLGFTTFDKSKTFLTVDETIIFSQDAKTVAQANFEPG
ncbi:MAG: DUF1190 domain-containing protein [Hyphomicrobiaceae bacterium]